MNLRPSRAAGTAALVAVALGAVSLYGCMSLLDTAVVTASGHSRGYFVKRRDGYRLLGPQARAMDAGPRVAPPKSAKMRSYALAFHYRAHVYDAPSTKSARIGSVRRGTALRAKAVRKARDCKSGWYQLSVGGFVCNQSGFAVSDAPQKFWIRQPKIDLNRPLFYRYARVTTPSALRFVRLPTEREEQQIAAVGEGRSSERASLPDVVQTRMEGDYFVALDREESAGARKFYRTVRGRYVRVEDIEERTPPAMRGVRLNERKRLPWVFVHGEGSAPLVRKQSGRLREVGRAERHGSYPLQAIEKRKSAAYALGPGGFGVPLARVRIARAKERPRGVGQREKWIHIDLTQQTLVAYEGDRAQFVTLVSSGKDGTHETPTGLYRVYDKHVSLTMSGDDPSDGHYEVGDVPWTQFYDRGYALHGAYWHDSFGTKRSHGCTNLAPPDARWLFYWTTPEVPYGLHTRKRAGGTAVYITREEPEPRRA